MVTENEIKFAKHWMLTKDNLTRRDVTEAYFYLYGVQHQGQLSFKGVVKLVEELNNVYKDINNRLVVPFIPQEERFGYDEDKFELDLNIDLDINEPNIIPDKNKIIVNEDEKPKKVTKKGKK